jgi:hypothetical protein
MNVHDVLEDVCVIHGGVAVGHLMWRQPSRGANSMKRLAVRLR